MKRRLPYLAVLVVVLAVVGTLLVSSGEEDAGSVRDAVRWFDTAQRKGDPLGIATPGPVGTPSPSPSAAPPAAADRPVLGLTLTQDTKVSRAEAKGLVAPGPLVNVHIMGFGTDNPQPSPERFDWGSLDARMELVKAAGGTPVITLCCAPDWMKGGREGDTDWSQLETAPEPEHFDDFARLSVAVAKRYPQARYFMVWNELKGFYKANVNRWDYEGYTAMYNEVYTALKAHDPSLRVGGPYPVMEVWSTPDTASHASAIRGPWGVVDQRSLDVVSYWLDNARGADFLAVDGGTGTKDKGPAKNAEAAIEVFGAITKWLRARTNLPIWWAEWYAESRYDDPGRRAAVLRKAVAIMRREGAAVALLWWSEHAAAPCWYCNA